jgi:hypothetical protein
MRDNRQRLIDVRDKELEEARIALEAAHCDVWAWLDDADTLCNKAIARARGGNGFDVPQITKMKMARQIINDVMDEIEPQ